MGSRDLKQPSKQYVSILTQNLRGSNSAKEAELILRFREGRIWAACFQETWEHGDDVYENEGITFLKHGLAVKECHRGSQGVAIALSPAARKAWEPGGAGSGVAPRELPGRARGAPFLRGR